MAALLDWLKVNWLLVSILGAVGLAFVLLRTSPTAGIDSTASLNGILTDGQPAVVEFYSNF